MIKKILAGLLIFSSAARAQLKWPAINRETKPWARWWWEGSAVDKKNLSANLADYAKAGLGGLEITPIYGVVGYEKQFIPFLSPQWMNMLDHTLAEAKRLDIGIDLANGTGWPFGGPTITDKEASKTVVFKTYTVEAGQQLSENIVYKQEALVRTANNKTPKIEDIKPVIAENNNLQDLALDQVKFPGELPLQLLMAYDASGNSLDLTNKVKGGKLEWTAPSANGKWTLYALFQGLHGKMVERAAPGGEGYAIDHFSKEALHHYFKRFDDAFKGHDISYVRALFNDSYEVDDARGQSNWTENFLAEFKKRRGYDLSKFLYALFDKANADLHSRVLYDYRSTIGDLILEDFTQEWKKWGTTKGAIIRNQSHGSPANLLDLYGAIDIPETEGDDILRYKFATSVSHVMGKKFASSESATWLNEHFLSSWGDVKKAIDLYLLGGVNHIFYHGLNYSPKEDPWPGWLFYAAVHFQQTDPQWKDFHALNEYIARAQSFLQAGKPDDDVLVYYPLADRYSDPGNALLQHFDGMGREFAGSDFEKVSSWMQSHGYAFDFFSDRQLQHFSNQGRQLLTGGNSFQTLLLPANEYIPLESFQKIFDLARNGATILVYKRLPKDIPGYHEMDKRRTAYNALVSQLTFAGDKVKTASLGKGKFILCEDAAALLEAAGTRRESLPENRLLIRRKNEDGHTYFVSNRSNKAVDEWIDLSVTAVTAALFDPMTGNNGIAQWKKSGNNISVRVQLKPYGTTLIRLYDTKKAAGIFPYLRADGKTEKIKGEWSLAFLDGGPVLPPPVKLDVPVDWTTFDGDTYKNFSGTAKYSVSFSRPMNGYDLLLDLGKVNETAEVIVNGKRIATLIGPEFSTVIPASALKENNRLDIIVANLMANRIAYMDRNNLPWKKFYNTNMPARRRENTRNGLFDASGWKPLPSGLSGPVTITPVSFDK